MEASGRRPIAEPIRKPWFWAGVAVLVLAGAPWYLPTGSLEPVLLGVPYWVWNSVFLSLVFCFYVRWGCLHLWNLVEDRERAAAEERDRDTIP